MVSTMDATGTRIREVRVDQNEPAAFAAYFQGLPEPSRVVVEACWNWGWLYDKLGVIDTAADVVLAHSFKTPDHRRADQARPARRPCAGHAVSRQSRGHSACAHTGQSRAQARHPPTAVPGARAHDAAQPRAHGRCPPAPVSPLCLQRPVREMRSALAAHRHTARTGPSPGMVTWDCGPGSK